MTFPLSKEEMNFLNGLQKRFELGAGYVAFSPGEYQKYQSLFSLMLERGIIIDARALQQNERAFYLYYDNLDGFLEWINAENNKAKRISRREWKIAIIAALIGALASHLPAILRFIGGLTNAN